MHLYMVIVDVDYPTVLEKIPAEDRCEIRDGIWFVVSKIDTAADFAQSLGINDNRPGIVTSARFYSGTAKTRIVEKLRAWSV